jgi:peptidoglycan/LPS O-acetylase OafA/YrhL
LRFSSCCCITLFLVFDPALPLTLAGEGRTTLIVTVGYRWLAFLYSGGLLMAISGASTRLQRVLCSRALTWLGTLAYCTYLIHLPLMEASRRVLERGLGYSSSSTQFVGGLVGIALTLGVAKLSWIFFEKPLLRRAHATGTDHLDRCPHRPA